MQWKYTVLIVMVKTPLFPLEIDRTCRDMVRRCRIDRIGWTGGRQTTIPGCRREYGTPGDRTGRDPPLDFLWNLWRRQDDLRLSKKW